MTDVPIANTTGPCQPWIPTERLRRNVYVKRAVTKATRAADSDDFPITEPEIDYMLASALATATDVLYGLSGRRFPGECTVTIRPLARPSDADLHGLVFRGYGLIGTGLLGANATSSPPALSMFGVSQAPEIAFEDYPVRQILEVKIDGDIIPADEYELRDQQTLIRTLPTASSQPTDRYGWPTSQRMDLPDTEPNTFSITYTYGADCGEGGRRACELLAAAWVCDELGDETRLPDRATSVERQGVTIQMASSEDLLQRGRTGIVQVDAWLQAVNPNNLTEDALVLTPDRPAAASQGKRY